MPDGASSSYFRVGDNIELWRVVVYLSVLIVLVMVLEQIMHRTEHALKKYPKYHEMLSKIYRELMILGLLGLGIKIVKELALVDGYGKNIMAFQVADLIVFISAFALIIQAIGVFSIMRTKNKQMDRDELVSSNDLIELVTRHEAMVKQQSCLRRLWPWGVATQVGAVTIRFSTARYREMIQIRTLRHFFLRKYGLPELFPFSSYLRQALDHQITHMIDIEMSMWVLLIFLTWVLDASTVLLENLDHMVEKHALPIMFLAFAVALTIFHFFIAWYLRSAVRQILAAAGYKTHKDMLRILQMVAAEETRNLEMQKPDKALEMMHHVQEMQESKQHLVHGGGHGGGHGDKEEHGGGHAEGHHDTGFQLLGICFRRVCCCKKSHEDDDDDHHGYMGEHAPAPLPKVKIRFFHRLGLHFLVKFLIMLNGFYFAFMCQAVLYELPEVYEKFGLFACLLVPMPLLANMFFFQPQICRNFVLVSCIFQVDVPTLSEVITNFSESVELRSDFVTCLKQSMQDHNMGISDLHNEFLVKDPNRTGYIELETLRHVLRTFGCQISFFRFNGIAKLLFRLKGTQVEYAQIERLLTLAEKEDQAGHSVTSSQCATGMSTQYPRYLSTVITEHTQEQRRDRVSMVSSSRYSEEITMLESFSTMPGEKKKKQPTDHFGLPRVSHGYQPQATTLRQLHPGESSTRAAGNDAGASSARGGHNYRQV